MLTFFIIYAVGIVFSWFIIGFMHHYEFDTDLKTELCFFSWFFVVFVASVGFVAIVIYIFILIGKLFKLLKLPEDLLQRPEYVIEKIIKLMKSKNKKHEQTEDSNN
jgi:hypothetical protein